MTSSNQRQNGLTCAQLFESTMVNIWDGELSRYYPSFHNAVHTARVVFGGSCVAHEKRPERDPEEWLTFRFRDGSKADVSIDGGSIGIPSPDERAQPIEFILIPVEEIRPTMREALVQAFAVEMDFAEGEWAKQVKRQYQYLVDLDV